MAIAFVNASSSTAATAGVAPANPAGLAAGHLILVALQNGAVATTWSAPPGYTSIRGPLADGANHQTQWYYRIATGTSDAFTTTQTAGTRFICEVAAYSGVDKASPLIVENGVVEGTTATTTHTAPSITNTDPAAWGVYNGAIRGIATPTTWTAGTGLTERLDVDALVATASNLSMQWSDTNGPVATGSVAYFGTGGNIAVGTMWAAFLRPDPNFESLTLTPRYY